MQLLFQIPFLLRIHALPRPKWALAHKGVRRVMTLMLPAIFGSSVAQVNVLIGGIIASMLGVGKISLLYYSDRLMEFPLGLFGIALATVTLPYLSIGLTVLAEPLVATIFYGGAFTNDDVRMTALALRAFAVGLIGFSYVKILAPAYFAREDTRTPVRIGLIALGVNFVLSISLAWYLTAIEFAGSHAGLALAISVAALLNALLLYRGLKRDGIVRHSPGWKKLLLQVGVANAVMWGILDWLNHPLAWWLDVDALTRIGWLALCVTGGAAVYFLVLLSLGMRPSNFMMRPH